MLILENAVNLKIVPPKGAYFISLPLKKGEGTGSPVRTVALIPKKRGPYLEIVNLRIGFKSGALH